MKYKSCIRNELGHLMYWCDELSINEETEILNNHPEWYISVERVD